MPHSLAWGKSFRLRTGPCQRAAVAALRLQATLVRGRPFDAARRAGTRSTATPRTRTASLIYNLLDDPHHRDRRQDGQEGIAHEVGRRRARRDNEQGAVRGRQQGVRRQQRRQDRASAAALSRSCRHRKQARRAYSTNSDHGRCKGMPHRRLLVSGDRRLFMTGGKWTLFSGTNLGQRDQEKPANTNTVQ